MAESWVRLWAGMTTDPNLVTACRDCNRRKGARTPEQWRGA